MLTNEKAEKACQEILDGGTNNEHEWNPPYETGYFFDKSVNMFLVFDNSTREFWVENFENEQDAIDWCEGKIEAAE